jgi:two-component sensor histidine kinase
MFVLRQSPIPTLMVAPLGYFARNEFSTQGDARVIKPITVHFETATTLAIIIASHEPLLLLSEDMKIVAASTSFCRDFGIDPITISGKPLAAIGHGEWNLPKLASLLEATRSGIAPIDVYELTLKPANCTSKTLLVNARTLDDGIENPTRLLVTVTDVTQARAETRLRDDLVREKAILLQEVQHRVANSLQIIASVLMQSAGRTQSTEAKGHIESAHGRVMAVASVQRLLSTSVGGKVDLQIYFTQLCRSLATSMIAQPNLQSIVVDVDTCFVEAADSISLGLIVTELVINALKHAFVKKQTGTITISYHAKGKDWSMSVADTGDGMPTGTLAPKAGLGTGIIEALARNLEGQIEVSNTNPGTCVNITHRESLQTGAAPYLAA